jgi:large subunit ribosomal protein L23
MPAKKPPAEKAAKKEAGKKAEKPKEVLATRESNPWRILKYPHLAEKSMKMVEAENKLVFMVRRNAKRHEIKEAIEQAFAVKVTKVNFEITMAGEKKAYVKLSPEFSAADIATRMGMV